MNLKNKRIVITGATSGIGQQLMVLLSKYEGTKIIAVGRKMKNIPIDMNIIPYQADVSNEKELDDLFDFSVKRLGGIDIFFANAGYAYFNFHDKATYKDFEDIYKTNVLAPIYCTKKMLDLYDRQKTEIYIAVTVSDTAKLPVGGIPIYVSTKFALDGFIKSVRYEVSGKGFISAIYPSRIRKTNFFEEMFHKNKTADPLPGKRMSAHEVAKAILKGIEKNKKNIYPDSTSRLIIAFFNLFPFLFKRYSKQKYQNYVDSMSQN